MRLLPGSNVPRKTPFCKGTHTCKLQALHCMQQLLLRPAVLRPVLCQQLQAEAEHGLAAAKGWQTLMQRNQLQGVRQYPQNVLVSAA